MPAEGREILEQSRRLFDRRNVLQLGTHAVRQLALVDVEHGPPLGRDQRKGEAERCVGHIGSAQIEQPGHRMRIADDQPMHALDRLPDGCQLRIRLLARVAPAMQADGADRRGGAIRPDLVDRIGLEGNQFRP